MATILKSNAPLPSASAEFTGVAGFNLDDLAAVGARQLRAVETEAERILAAAREESQAIRQQAAEQGRAEGIQQGMRDAEQRIAQQSQAEVAKRIPLLEATLQQCCNLQRDYLESFRETLIATVIAATERVVLRKLETEPEVLQRWAEAAIAACNSAKRIVVLVHPETLASHGEALEQLLAKPGLPEDSRIEPDESIEPAGVVVRTEGGSVTLTLSEQLQRLDEMLRGDST